MTLAQWTSPVEVKPRRHNGQPSAYLPFTAAIREAAIAVCLLACMCRPPRTTIVPLAHRPLPLALGPHCLRLWRSLFPRVTFIQLVFTRSSIGGRAGHLHTPIVFPLDNWARRCSAGSVSVAIVLRSVIVPLLTPLSSSADTCGRFSILVEPVRLLPLLSCLAISRSRPSTIRISPADAHPFYSILLGSGILLIHAGRCYYWRGRDDAARGGMHLTACRGGHSNLPWGVRDWTTPWTEQGVYQASR
jgi:hypothetical protein